MDVKRLPGHVEVVDLGDRRAEALVTLRGIYERTKHGMVTGLLVVVERPDGAYTASDVVMTGCDNAAERIGRIRFLMHELEQMERVILAMATETMEDDK